MDVSFSQSVNCIGVHSNCSACACKRLRCHQQQKMNATASRAEPRWSLRFVICALVLGLLLFNNRTQSSDATRRAQPNDFSIHMLLDCDYFASQNIRIKNNNLLRMLFGCRVHVFSNIHSRHLFMASMARCLFDGNATTMLPYLGR